MPVNHSVNKKSPPIHILCVGGINPTPMFIKASPPLFFPAPLLNLQTVQARPPFYGNSSEIFTFFIQSPLKICFLNELP